MGGSTPQPSRQFEPWDEGCQIGWLLKLEHPVSNRGNFKTNPVANRKPVEIRKNRRDATEPRFLGDHTSKGILDKLKAIQVSNRCASQERVAEVKSGANYCCSYSFRSLGSKRGSDMTQCTNMKKTGLACLRHLLIKGHL